MSSDGASSDGPPEEPLLKFQRMRSSLASVFEADAASAVAVFETFLTVGTQSGALHVLDFHGNEIQRLAPHSQRVNDVSIDRFGEYCASSSDDGRVVVMGLQTGSAEAFDYYRFVKCVRLDPEFARRREKLFVSGGVAGQCVLNRKGWMGAKDQTLHEGEGAIDAISWRGPLIAWCNDWGVKLYDAERQQRISFIERPQQPEHVAAMADEGGSSSSEGGPASRCRLAWDGEATLLIGWGAVVMTVAVRERDREAVAVNSSVPLRYAEIVGQFEVDDGVVAGLSPFDSASVAVLVHVPDDMPELRLLHAVSGDVLSADALPVRGYEHLRAVDYSLESSATGAGSGPSSSAAPDDAASSESPPEETTPSGEFARAGGVGAGGLGGQREGVGGGAVDALYVVSPKDIIVARRRDADDRISWALEAENYGEAVAIAAAEPRGALREHSFNELVELYLQDLVARDEFAAAAALCPQLLGGDAVLWERWVYVFAQKRQLHHIAPVMPTGNPRLSSQQYEMLLEYFLHTDAEAFLGTLRAWPRPTPAAPLYDAAALIDKVLHRLRSGRPPMLLEALAELYSMEKRHADALEVFLELQDVGARDSSRVFELIADYNLFDAVSDKVLALVRLSREAAGNLLVTHMDRLLVPSVVAQLRGDRALQLWYLHLVFRRRTEDFNVETYADLHELLVQLYAEHAPPYVPDPARPDAYKDYDSDLLKFLRKSNYAPLETAYKACAAREPPLFQEMVYVLGRMGHTREALKIITEELRNVRQAIDFVESSDPELWQVLMDKSLQTPAFLAGLLEHAGSLSHVQPARLIAQIPEGMVVPQLGEKVMTIMSDCRLQLALREGCNRVLESDTLALFGKLCRAQRRGVAVEPAAPCASQACAKPLRQDVQMALVIFACGHAYHEPCLMELAAEPGAPVPRDEDRRCVRCRST